MKELTPEQQDVHDKAVDFYRTPGVTFLSLEGWAGVGKTFTTQRIIKTLQSQNPNIKIAMTAPTHKAVKVTRAMAEEYGIENVEFLTIYSCLGMILDNNQEIRHTKKAAEGSFADMDLVIIDEASMLPRNAFAELEATAKALNIPVILMGDSFQLPPVKEPNSIAFEKAQIKLRLDKIMRQEQGNPILEVTASLRDDIRNHTSKTVIRSKINKELDKGVYALNGPAWVKSVENNFVSDEYKEDPDLFRVLAWTNHRVDSLNRKIRKLLVGETESPFIPGERLITRRPIAEGEGSQRVQLAYTDEECEVIDIALTTHPLYANFSIQFSVWAIRLLTVREEVAEVYLLHRDSVADYWSTLNTLKDRAKTDRGQWRAAHNFEDSFADLQPPHALTVHRSQGSTYKNVFVDLIDCYKNPDVLERNKLLYVACSRASDNLIALKRPVR
jgi:ATP-dependent exoDNAse (exonuclease V) alpha subunit